jgi:hypothetical protein
MQKTIGSALMLLAMISCGETAEKKVDQNTNQTSPKTEESGKPLPSGDYSSLFLDYECDMTTTEVAKAMDVPETDVSLAEYQRPGRCAFSIKGFGKNTLGDDTVITWFLEKVGKTQVKKEIQSYLKDKANNESVLGMGIDLSETGDSYIAKMPMSGRAALMNENYDSWLFFNYSQKGMYKSRTEEEHAALGEKTIALANYLLKKHLK